MTTTTGYERFLARAAAGLAASGAQLLLSPEVADRAVPWAAGWDQLVLADGPGAQILYAFVRGESPDAAWLQARVDRLASGLAQSGALGRSPAPVTLVVVPVFAAGIDSHQAGRLSHTSPSRFYPGLRPHSWVVDLAAGRVYPGGRLGRPEGSDAIQRAARGEGPGAVLDDRPLEELERRHIEQTTAFYRLMRGRQPWITYGLIVINTAVFVLMYLRGGQAGVLSDSVLRDFGAMEPGLVQQGQWWRLFSDMFLHASVAHILFNMVSLFAIGTLAERLYGSWKFLAIYLGAGLIGSLASFGYAEATGAINILAVGASGAIFGVAAALVTVRFHVSDIIPKRLRDRVSSSMLPLVGLSLLFAYATPHVDNSAHVGGLLGGAALSFLFPLSRRAGEYR